MYITVYIQDKPLFVCDNMDDIQEKYQDKLSVIVADDISVKAITTLVEEIKKPEFFSGVLLYNNWKKLNTAFFKHFTVVQTGGGLITNNKDEILLIFRRGKWDLPKGKLDDNETLEQCAIREVEEETGLKNIELGNEIKITYHIYTEHGKTILKEAHWYNMICKTEQDLIPQTEEQITDIRWIKQTELVPYLQNTFPTIIDVLSTLKNT